MISKDLGNFIVFTVNTSTSFGAQIWNFLLLFINISFLQFDLKLWEKMIFHYSADYVINPFLNVKRSRWLVKNYRNHFCSVPLYFKCNLSQNHFGFVLKTYVFFVSTATALSHYQFIPGTFFSAFTFFIHKPLPMLPLENPHSDQWDKLILYSVPANGSFNRVEHVCSCLHGPQYLKHSCLLYILPDLLLFSFILCLSVRIGPLVDAKTQEHQDFALLLVSAIQHTYLHSQTSLHFFP